MMKKHWEIYAAAALAACIFCGCGKEASVSETVEEPVTSAVSVSTEISVPDPVTEVEDNLKFTEDEYPILDGSTQRLDTDETGEVPLTRLKAEYMKEYEAGTATNCIYPILIQENSGGEYPEEVVRKYGLVDDTGVLVCDGVFDYVRNNGDGWVAGSGDQAYFISFDGQTAIKRNGGHLTFDGEFYHEYAVITPFTWDDVNDPKKSSNCFSDVKEYTFDKMGNLVGERMLNTDHSLQKGVFTEYERLTECVKLSVYSYRSNDKYLILETDGYYYDRENDSDTYVESVYDIKNERIVFSTEDNVKICDNGTFILRDYNYDTRGSYILNSEGNRLFAEKYYEISYLGSDCYQVQAKAEGSRAIYKLKDSSFSKILDIGYDFSYGCGDFIELVAADGKSVKFLDFDGNELSIKTNKTLQMWENAFAVISTRCDPWTYENYYVPSQDPITGRYYARDVNNNIYDCSTNEVIYSEEPCRIYEPTEWDPNPSPEYRLFELFNDKIINADYYNYKKPINIKTGKSYFDYSIFYWESTD